MFNPVPEELAFEVSFESSLVPHKKYVINEQTGQPLDIVGENFSCVSHLEFFTGVQDVMLDYMQEAELFNNSTSYRSSRNGAWAMMDIVLPEVSRDIETQKHVTKVQQRIIALHGIDGSCSNQVYFGAIDFFCTNGMILGDWSTLKRKNTSGFDLSVFVHELKQRQVNFSLQMDTLDEWADVTIKPSEELNEALVSLMGKRKGNQMFLNFLDEAATRGCNLFALYSAFTNYATYADERNGFELRKNKHDTQEVNMWKRAQEVNAWTNSNEWEYISNNC